MYGTLTSGTRQFVWGYSEAFTNVGTSYNYANKAAYLTFLDLSDPENSSACEAFSDISLDTTFSSFYN